jgi:uncharacterized Zn finger protein
MSPPRKGAPRGRDDLDALRARLAKAEARARTSPTKARRKTRAEDEPDDEWDEEWPETPDGRWWEHEEPGRPRPVAGGIAARTRKGPIGATWWSRRFLESIESVMVGGRTGRGRAYARKGQVVDLEVSAGVVAASVQGSREDPYAVRLRLPVVPPEDWDAIVGALGAHAGYAARMLAGDLPPEVEEVFETQGASLLPAPHARLVTECSCPDWENPCKHIAAVCYLLAEEFDRDPFSLLAWRGRGRDQVLADLRARRRTHVGPEPEVEAAGGDTTAGPPGEGDGAGRDERDALTRFWTAGPELAQVRVLPGEAHVPAAALRLAPRGTIVVRGGDLVDVLAPVYRAIAAAAAARARR